MGRTMTARERSQWLEQLAIQEAALDLTLERGYSGFTMDELAQQVGMPRRTLFQRVGHKFSAVLGVDEDDALPAEAPADVSLSPLDAFVAAALQLVELVQVDETVVAIHAKMLRAIAQEPSLAAEAERRTARHLDRVADMLRRQHGWDEDDPRARVLSRVMGALVDEAIARVVTAREQGRSLDFGVELQSLVTALHDVVRVSEGGVTR